MMKRKGLGRGLGKGYKNIVPRDPFIHGLSAKGVKSRLYGRSVPAWGCPCGYSGTKREMTQHKKMCPVYKKEVKRDKEFKKLLGLDAKGKADYVPKKTPKYEYVWGGDVFDDDNEGLLYGVEDVSDFPEYVEWFSSWEEREKNSKAGKMNIVNREQHYDYLKRKKILDAKMSATELEKNLSMFIGTEQYHKLSFMPLLATDGVAYLMKEAESYWLFDAIASYQPKLKKEPFQVWILEKDKTGSGAVLKGYRDYSEEKPKKYKPLVTQKIQYTDFPLKKVKIWVENGVALLPSEH